MHFYIGFGRLRQCDSKCRLRRIEILCHERPSRNFVPTRHTQDRTRAADQIQSICGRTKYRLVKGSCNDRCLPADYLSYAYGHDRPNKANRVQQQQQQQEVEEHRRKRNP